VCLAALPDPQRVFVGGGGPEVGAIVREAIRRLLPGGRVVITAALLETLETARTVLTEAGWDVEVVQLQVSRLYSLSGGAALQALNPVWIVTGYLAKGPGLLGRTCVSARGVTRRCAPTTGKGKLHD
jgi:precorrin-6Y C5,15-methyltransferase (decarboxylating)